MSAVIVGYIESDIITLLGLGIVPQPVFWGDSNIEHVEINHPATYAKYGQVLASVISGMLQAPDYVGERNGAIEYVKIMPDGEILKAAVRASKKWVFYVRTVYPIKHEELGNFLSKGTLVKLA